MEVNYDSSYEVRKLGWKDRLRSLSRKQIAPFLVIGLTSIIGVATLQSSSAAYAYTTIYTPNVNANATLLACKDVDSNNVPIVRLKYTGNDSPFIRMKTTFGPAYPTPYVQTLKKYVVNWIWQGSYPLPAGASTIRVTFVFDDKSTDSGNANLVDIVKCTDTPPPAPTVPTVTITAPANGATVSGTTTVSANASDTQGIRSLQFKVDGADTGAPDTTAPFSLSWNTVYSQNGTHTLTVVATNVSGLTSTSAPITVVVANQTIPAPTPPPPPTNSSIKPLTPNTAWDWILSVAPTSANLDKSTRTKKMIDVDLEDNSATTIAGFKSKGIAVVCYFSAGSSENWRSDYNMFPASVQGNNLAGWPGEKWLDIRSSVVLDIMKARMDVAVTKGCDGIEPDNIDGYTNNTGFPLTGADQITYLTNLANAAHGRNLSIGLKNDVDQVQQLAPKFDFAVNEQCYQYNECGVYAAFINANKAVFNAEYKSLNCTAANAANIDSVLFALELNNTKYQSCR